MTVPDAVLWDLHQPLYRQRAEFGIVAGWHIVIDYMGCSCGANPCPIGYPLLHPEETP